VKPFQEAFEASASQSLVSLIDDVPIGSDAIAANLSILTTYIGSNATRAVDFLVYILVFCTRRFSDSNRYLLCTIYESQPPATRL
jgi:hypothetical protein